MLCAVGDLVEDVVARLEGPVRTGGDAAARITRGRGGSAANTAAVAARLAGRSRFVGAVGSDPMGDRLLDELGALGVDCRVQRRGRSGTILALVTADGERSFVTDRGASPSLTEPAGDVLDGVDVLHLPGYGLGQEPLASTVRALAASARERSVAVSVDPSSITLGADLGVEAYREAIAALGPDVLLPNRAEAAQLDLLDRPLAPLTVVTAGSQSTMALAGDERIVVPVADGPAVDTTGAGDAFAAGFLTRWVGGGSVEAAVEDGHAAAAKVIGGAGAGAWEDRA